MLTVGLYQATTKAEIDSPTLPRPHSVHLEAAAVKSKQASRNTASTGQLSDPLSVPSMQAGLQSSIPFRANHSY